MPLKVVKVQEGGKTYRIERQGQHYLVEYLKGNERIFIAKVKGSFDAARETCRWHLKKSLGLKTRTK